MEPVRAWHNRTGSVPGQAVRQFAGRCDSLLFRDIFLCLLMEMQGIPLIAIIFWFEVGSGILLLFPAVATGCALVVSYGVGYLLATHTTLAIPSCVTDECSKRSRLNATSCLSGLAHLTDFLSLVWINTGTRRILCCSLR